MPRIITNLEDADDEERPFVIDDPYETDNQGDGELYNIYGQRYHPSASPFDYQHVPGSNMPKIISSTQGNHGKLMKAPVSYEEKYNLKPKDEDIENRILTNLDGPEEVKFENSSYFLTNQLEMAKERKEINEAQMFTSLLFKLLGLPIFIMPVILGQIGLLTFAVSFLISLSLNIYGFWMVDQCAKLFNVEPIHVTSLHDLSFFCFTEGPIIFQEICRLLISLFV